MTDLDCSGSASTPTAPIVATSCSVAVTACTGLRNHGSAAGVLLLVDSPSLTVQSSRWSLQKRST